MLYFSIAGQMIASNDGSGLQYFLTDQLGSIVAVVDGSSTLLSQQRYLSFGQVRTSVGSITQTDFGYLNSYSLWFLIFLILQRR
jgi:hypothetical protein